MGQLALRAPVLHVTPDKEEKKAGTQWHIDGMDTGKHSPFSLLVGVALSDQSQPDCGNLIAFPGSHHSLHPLLREQVDTGSGLFSNQAATGKPCLTGSQQILLQPGDAVLLHQKVAHRIGINCSPNIRYQTYFRLRHTDHAAKLEDGSLLDDLWTEFQGLADDLP
jgi:ectoine hydroxylase-related dioxygenase (phytanoyl-CoA dioxygenase family)